PGNHDDRSPFWGDAHASMPRKRAHACVWRCVRRQMSHGEHVMVTPSRRTDPSPEDLPRGLLVVAAVLIGVGSALGLAGLAMGAAALATAGRRWYSRADLSP